MSSRRTTWILGLGFLAGLASGWLLFGLDAPPTSEGPVLGEDPTSDASSETGAPLLEARGRERTPRRATAKDVAPGTGTDASPAGSSGAAAESPTEDLEGFPPGVRAWIRVIVEPAPGESVVSGEAYVLPAGGAGVDDIEAAPHTDANSEEPGLIPLGQAGVYDVGFAWREHATLRRDVEVRDGETVTVAFQASEVGSVRVQLDDPLPTIAGAEVYAMAYLGKVAEGDGTAYPGRGEYRSYGWSTRLQAGTTTFGRLVPGERARLTLRLVLSRREPRPMFRTLASHALVASMETVEAGDLVRVRVVPSAALTLELGHDPSRWPVGLARQLTVEVAHARGTERLSIWFQRRDQMKPDFALRRHIAVAPGPVEVRWRGRDVEPGVLRGTMGDTGSALTLRGELALAASASALGRPLRLDVVWPAGAPEDEELKLCGIIHRSDGEDLAGWTVARTDTDPRESMMREACPLVGVIGHEFATPVLRRPQGDTLRIKPVRGGLIVVVPAIVTPGRLGRLVLRRADGLPIPRVDGGFAARIEVETGQRIGPFPPGTHVFHVSRGGQQLPDARVVVRAGRNSPMVVGQ